MKWWWQVLAVLLAVVGLFFAGWFACSSWHYKHGEWPENGQEHRDTTWLHDTTYVDKPVPVEVVPHGYEIIPVGTLESLSSQILALEDSLEAKPKVVVKDSLVFIEVPMEQKHYTDSLYDAWVSGYKPSLDSLHIYQTTQVITITKERPAKRWGVGPQVGVGLSPNGVAVPYVGIGVQYNLLTF